MEQVKGTAISVFALILAFIWLTPLVQLVGTAFSEPTLHMAFSPNSRFTSGNLPYIWNTIPSTWCYLNTLIPVMVTFCIQFVISTLATYTLAVVDFKGRTLVSVVVFVQIIIPDDVLVTPNFATLADMGLVDTRVGIMLPLPGSTLAIFLLRQHFKSIPKASAEATRINSVNTWRAIQRVCMPCTKPVYMSSMVISVSYHWNNCLWPLIVIDSPSNRTLIVGFVIFAKSKETSMQQANVRAATSIIILPLSIASLLLQRQFMNGFINAGIRE